MWAEEERVRKTEFETSQDLDSRLEQQHTEVRSSSKSHRFVLAHVVQLVLAFDALVAKNTIQVMALLIFNTLFLAYAAIQVRLLHYSVVRTLSLTFFSTLYFDRFMRFEI